MKRFIAWHPILFAIFPPLSTFGAVGSLMDQGCNYCRPGQPD